MENNYKELFQKILPKIKINLPKSSEVIYRIEYYSFMLSDNFFSVGVNYNIDTYQEKIKLSNEVLNELLMEELMVISKYINLGDKSISVHNINS